MKDIKVHNNILLSIKPIIMDVYYDRQYFKDIIIEYIKISKTIYVGAMRPEQKTKNLIENIRKVIPKTDMFISHHRELNEIALFIEITEMNINIQDNVIDIILNIWTIYEQPALVFSINNQFSIEERTLLASNRLSWEKTVNLTSSYMIFKGVEDDVLWISKSSNLVFIELPNYDTTQFN